MSTPDFDTDYLMRLYNTNVEELTEREAKDFLIHLRNQFINRYHFIVGEWRNARRAKDTRTGQFVTKEEVIEYLED